MGCVSMDLSAIKWATAGIVLAAAWVGGWLGYGPSRLRLGHHGLGYSNAFASGVVLGTGLLHMLPEASHVWNDLYPHYPVAPFLAGLAFLLLLLIEHVLLSHRGHRHGELAPHGTHELAGELAVHAADRPISAYVLLVGLSIHSLLAGIALGAQSEVRGTIAVLVAIVAHKATEGFAIGVSLASSEVAQAQALRLLAAFATATPIGIALGMIAAGSMSGTAGQAFEASFSAIAGGTFLYIASLDMIGEEFSHGERSFTKWCWATFGLLLVASLAGH